MAEKISLETEAASIGGGQAGAIGKKCCTKSRAEALGCIVSGNYSDNQLVPRSALSKKYDIVRITANVTNKASIKPYKGGAVCGDFSQDNIPSINPDGSLLGWNPVVVRGKTNTLWVITRDEDYYEAKLDVPSSAIEYQTFNIKLVKTIIHNI